MSCRYSGCHDYDVSALNVLLGRHFEFREGDYVSQPRFFTRYRCYNSGFLLDLNPDPESPESWKSDSGSGSRAGIITPLSPG